ncbi:beta-lactamase superfamily domain-containing protein [Trichoderma ceciliae]
MSHLRHRLLPKLWQFYNRCNRTQSNPRPRLALFVIFTAAAATATSAAALTETMTRKSTSTVSSTSRPFPSSSTTVTKIPGRTNIPQEAISNPHHIVKSSGSISGFKNPYPSWSNPPSFASILGTVIWPTVTGELKWPDTKPPTVPVFASGLRVLFDPVFEDRCSPFSFMGPKRFTPRPCDLKDIPVVDAVVISHSHYDHLSHASVLEIQRHHPQVQFFVGLGLEAWFRRSGLKNVTELDWWQDAGLTVSVPVDGENRSISAQISCLPCQHTSARSAFDKDTTLWCSWAVCSGGKSVWFGGDTGYRAVPHLPPHVDDYGAEYDSLPRCPQFKHIGEHRGPFDLGLIPIGAYSPRSTFSAMHANPFDSVEIFRDTKCQRAMGIHWGTWALTMEEVLEPPRQLREALKRKGIPEEGVFDVCDIGQSREF